MKFLVVIFSGLLSTTASFALLRRKPAEPPPNGDRIVVYLSGQTQVLQPRSSNYRPILDEAEQLFSAADSTFKLSIDQPLIDGLKREAAVEVIYSSPKAISVSLGGLTQVSRLLIPIKGRFASGQKPAVFFGNPDYGAFNVVLSSRPLDRMRALVEKTKTGQ